MSDSSGTLLAGEASLWLDWRISEYELVDDNEASHVDKLVVLLSEFLSCVIRTVL